MPPTDIVRDLELLVRSRYALIVLDTIEDDRAAERDTRGGADPAQRVFHQVWEVTAR